MNPTGGSTAQLQWPLEAEINYAGAIQGRARFDVADMSRTNLVLESRPMTVADARTQAEPPSLDREGFALVPHSSAVCHAEDMAEIDRVYHQEVAALIRDVTGADVVAPQRSGLLIRRGERAKKPTWARPARFAHLDYSPKSVGDFTGWMQLWEGVDASGFSRMAIFQTWRATSPPPQDNTLALCDARSLAPEDTLVFDAVLKDTGAPGDAFESRLCKPNTAHRWLFWPDLHDHELLVFKAYDSDPRLPSDVPHSAIENPLAGPDAFPRESLEARFFAFFR